MIFTAKVIAGAMDLTESIVKHERRCLKLLIISFQKENLKQSLTFTNVPNIADNIRIPPHIEKTIIHKGGFFKGTC